MAHRIIEIPGGRTTNDDAPEVKIVAPSDHPVTLIIMYYAGGTAENRVFGELSFEHVLEYRWKADFVCYEDHPEHEEDAKLGLIEIIDSRYVADMATKGQLRDYPGKRFGLGLNETQVRHFRISFDDHGRYDIIALEVSVREIVEDD
ncbi:MAG: hypothetical protein DMF61_19200 [Blastocatellia bacterium AA13]|nr:MAG: hypothetical protein DMF61_19200 [Blastocatellia bacterium AA13]